MKTKAVLTCEDVQAIMAAARQHAASKGWAVTISVVDEGGILLGLLRLDGAAPLSSMLAPNKARTAALSWKDSGSYEERINAGQAALLSAPLDGMLEGGTPIRVDGRVIGAVGVSGAQSFEDLEIARTGIAALGIR